MTISPCLVKRLAMFAFAVIVLTTFSTEAKADLAGICSTDPPGQCTATVGISGNVLTITLTNTAPALNSGFITAAAFNLTAGTVVNSFTTTNANFGLFGAAPTGWTGSVSPDGSRTHLISATGNDYNGGGSPTGGVGTGSSVTFTLTLASLNGNTEQSVFENMLIRARGFADGGSDKDFLITQVPEPASMLLLGTGLLGAAAGIRRRRRNR